MGAALSDDRIMRMQVCSCGAMSTAGWQSLSADRKDEDHPRGNSTEVGQGKPRWRASLFSSESFSAALPVLLRAWEISSLWLSELQNPTNKFPICLSYLEFFHWPFYKVLGWELGQSIIIECSPEITPWKQQSVLFALSKGVKAPLRISLKTCRTVDRGWLWGCRSLELLRWSCGKKSLFVALTIAS